MCVIINPSVCRPAWRTVVNMQAQSMMTSMHWNGSIKTLKHKKKILILMHLKQSTFLMIFTQMLIKSCDQILTLMRTVFHFSCCSTDLMLIVSWTVFIASEKKSKVILFTSSANSWSIHSSVSHLIGNGGGNVVISKCLYSGWFIMISTQRPLTHQGRSLYLHFTLADMLNPLFQLLYIHLTHSKA